MVLTSRRRARCCATLILAAFVLQQPELAHAQAQQPTADQALRAEQAVNAESNEQTELAEPAGPDGYRELVNEAVLEYNAHNFAEARGLFSRAHGLFPNARTARGLGAVEFELRNYSESIRYLEAALASNVRPLDLALRTKSERLLERARRFVARLRLILVPEGSQVVIDGVPVHKEPELLLSVGDHVLEFRAVGHLSERRSLHVHGGELQTLQVSLARSLPIATNTRATHEREEPLYKKRWLWIATAAVVAASATALALTLPREQREASPLPGSTGKELP